MESTVTNLIAEAFKIATSRQYQLYERWIALSGKIGPLLPHSLLHPSIQRSGEMDLLLRCMEDDYASATEEERAANLMSLSHLVMLSEIWIGGIYEVFRLIIERKLMTDETIETLAHDLRLIRVQIEKHEIPIDRKLSEQLQAAFRYSPKDNLRAHIPSKTITSRGSVVWQVIDLKQSNVRWLERRYIADRVLAL